MVRIRIEGSGFEGIELNSEEPIIWVSIRGGISQTQILPVASRRNNNVRRDNKGQTLAGNRRSSVGVVNPVDVNDECGVERGDLAGVSPEGEPAVQEDPTGAVGKGEVSSRVGGDLEGFIAYRRRGLDSEDGVVCMVEGEAVGQVGHLGGGVSGVGK
uniref:Uncharacterized protein n=1 Tax=Opuntia streptacantha TaxID=393608 RepID=A0A7C9ERR1_OPUST